MTGSVFIIIPFREPFEDLYEHTLKPALEDVGLNAITTKQMSGIKWPFKKIHEGIRASEFCIADITGLNANVMYEVGYATAAGKKVIIIWDQSEMAEPPFDVNYFMGLPYDSVKDKFWSSKLAKEIKVHAKAELNVAKPAKQVATQMHAQKESDMTTLGLKIVTILAIAKSKNQEISVAKMPSLLEVLGEDIVEANLCLDQMLHEKIIDRDHNANGDAGCCYYNAKAGNEYLRNHPEEFKEMRKLLPDNYSNFGPVSFDWGRF